jgi:hypothetical protein
MWSRAALQWKRDHYIYWIHVTLAKMWGEISEVSLIWGNMVVLLLVEPIGQNFWVKFEEQFMLIHCITVCFSNQTQENWTALLFLSSFPTAAATFCEYSIWSYHRASAYPVAAFHIQIIRFIRYNSWPHVFPSKKEKREKVPCHPYLYPK